MRTSGDSTTDGVEDLSPSITHPRQYLAHVLHGRGRAESDLPESCVVTYCSGLLDRALRECDHSRLDIGGTVPTRIYVINPGSERSYGVVAGRPGAPMAAVLLEELIELGFRRFVVFGSAGHPTNDSGIAPYGQVIVPDRVYVYEGTSRHYGMTRPWIATDGALRASLEDALRREGIACRTGPAATTDAFYRETREFILELLSLDVLALEMELSAMLSVARFRGCRVASLLGISDVIHVGGEWRVGLPSEEFEAIQGRVLPAIARVLTA